MNLTALRSSLRVLLPAALLLASCSKKDEPTPVPVPDTGKVLFWHVAAASSTPLNFFANEQQAASLNYGQNSPYVSVTAGNAAIRLNNGTQMVDSKVLTVAKNQSYTVFAYSPANTIGSASLLTVTDDLTAPATVGTAKVRLVHLGVNAATPLRLAIPAATPTGTPAYLTPDAAFGSASSFILLNAGPQNLVVTSSSGSQPLVVGDGSGTGTGSKTYEAGKIYTVLVRGIDGPGVPTAQQVQVVVLANN
jgi:Domain of unknown function (DUF4397)